MVAVISAAQIGDKNRRTQRSGLRHQHILHDQTARRREPGYPMAGHKTDDGEAEPKSRDIDLERVLYDPEYRQAVQETLSPDTPPGRPPRDVKPQKG